VKETAMRRTVAVLPLAIALVVPLAACGKIQECNKVIETINNSELSKSSDVKNMSKQALDLEKQLADLNVSDEELKKLVGQYRDNLKTFADLGEKSGKADLGSAADIAKKSIEAGKQSDELTNKINEYCTGSK
jgi:hypothetical protein